MHDGFLDSDVQQLKQRGYVIDQRRFGDLHLIKRTHQGLEAASEASGRGKSMVR